MNGRAASNSRRLRTQTALSLIIVLVGLGLLVAGVVAAFVSSNSSASAALIAVGAASLLIIVFRDRIQEAKVGGLEIKLAVQMKDQLRTALDLKVRGNYEGAEWEITQAFERFVGELDVKEYREVHHIAAVQGYGPRNSRADCARKLLRADSEQLGHGFRLSLG